MLRDHNGPEALIIWKKFLSQICSNTIFEMHTTPRACLLYALWAVCFHFKYGPGAYLILETSSRLLMVQSHMVQNLRPWTISWGQNFKKAFIEALRWENNISSKIILSNTSLSKMFLSNMNMANYIMSYIMFGQIRFVQNILVLGQLGPILFCPKIFRPKSFSPLTLCSHTSFVQIIFVPLFLVLHLTFSTISKIILFTYWPQNVLVRPWNYWLNKGTCW